MSLPLDLGGLELLLALILLVGGTVVFCVATALAVRAVDAAWDAVSARPGDRRTA